MWEISGKVRVGLNGKIIRIGEEESLEGLGDEYEGKEEEGMNIEVGGEQVVERREDGGYNVLGDNVEEGMMVE